jgi:class 3 adenylate cyclase
MLGLTRLGIQSKMILLLLVVSLASISAVAILGYSSARVSLKQAVENQLNGVRVSKTTTLKEILESLSDQVVSMSDSQVALDGMRSFKNAFRELASKSLAPVEEERLKTFYSSEFLPLLSKQLEAQPVLESYMPASSVARYLQYHYLANNPHPYKEKGALADDVSDKSQYGEQHARLHKLFSRVVKIFGFEDLMLVDPDTLEVVYSYQKTTEFGTSFLSGPYANSNLGDRLRLIKAARDRDDFRIADFEPYRPSLGAPMGFAMSPIFEGSNMIGILVLQFPIEIFNKVLTGDYQWKEEGLGETGESFVVGSDKTLRSRSRFMYQDPSRFLKDLKDAGVSSKVVDRIERQATAMNVLAVNSLSVDRALQGLSGITVTRSYMGKDVLSSYGPLELDSLRWAVVSEIELDEAYAPIRRVGRMVVVASSAIALLVSALALICSQLLTKPLRELTRGARRIGAGETDVKVQVRSRDEFGELGTVFNEMADNIRMQTDRLEEQVRKNQELLLNILPASAVAQRQEGDERASREFADVSVLFAELVGLEEFSQSVGEARALAVLGDLIASFDDVADRVGIEKVKTIGASYLAVCGLSVSRPDHTRRVIQFADEIVRIVMNFNREQRSNLSLAIGVNCGPVAGGIVGKRRFLYDLWGDTVTIAKKLASGDGGAIRVTQGVYARLGDEFKFSGPLSFEVAGKPAIEAWQIAV